MEEVDLRTPSYWEAPGVDIRLNPRLDLAADGLASFVAGELGLESAAVFATSGSAGAGPKFVVLKKRALLASAEAVNRHLEAGRDDRWLCALTTFHVGGTGVWARGRMSGGRVFEIGGERWDKSGAAFVKACRDWEITLTALTPAHLHDVVASGSAAPGSLRAVLIGGDALDETLLEKALRLGWPILRTYGMTEAASQIATDDLGIANARDRPEFLPVLPGWEARVGAGGSDRLEIRGAPLFECYVLRHPETGKWTAEPSVSEDGFFATGDRVRLSEPATGGSALAFLGRLDDRIKILGEQVSLLKVRERLRGFFPGQTATILARPHERMGCELVAVIESGESQTIPEGVEAYNKSVAPYERIDRVFTIDRIERTGVGKIAHGRLAEALERGELKRLFF